MKRKEILYEQIISRLAPIIRNIINENVNNEQNQQAFNTIQVQIAYANKLLWFYQEYFKNLKIFYNEEPKWKTNFSEDFVKMFEETYKNILPDISKYARAVKKYCNENNIHIDKQYDLLNKINENSIYVQNNDNYKNLIQNIGSYIKLGKIVKNYLPNMQQDEIIEKPIFDKLIGEYMENLTKIYNKFDSFSNIIDGYKNIRM